MGPTNISYAPRLRPLLTSPWPCFAAVLSLSWVALIWHHLSSHSLTHSATWTVTLSAWTLMTIAMMTPTAVPVMISLRELLGAMPQRPWWAFLGGYLAVWIGFAVVATGTQTLLMRAAIVHHDAASASYVFTAVVLIAAGAYQFSALKHRCVTKCVAPMTFFLRYWRDGTQGGARMGVRHGVSCLGCCSALMTLAFVGGLANVRFMVLCAVVMAMEKLPSISRFVTAPLGVALVAAGLIVVVAGASTSDPATPHHHQSLAPISRTKGIS